LTGYRICHNEAPHLKDWWTVEKSSERKRFLRSPEIVWSVVRDYKLMRVLAMSIHVPDRHFKTRDEAVVWVEEDKRPRVHTCEEIS